jgi:hypothetical protein
MGIRHFANDATHGGSNRLGPKAQPKDVPLKPAPERPADRADAGSQQSRDEPSVVPDRR